MLGTPAYQTQPPLFICPLKLCLEAPYLLSVLKLRHVVVEAGHTWAIVYSFERVLGVHFILLQLYD